MTMGRKFNTLATLLVTSSIASGVSAADFVVNTAETVTNAGIGYDDHDTMTITSSGSIQVTENEAVSNEVDFFTLTNNGTLSAINAVPPPFHLLALSRRLALRFWVRTTQSLTTT